MRNIKPQISPHLAIYKMQLNSFSSIFHRFCGVSVFLGFIFIGMLSITSISSYYLSENLCVFYGGEAISCALLTPILFVLSFCFIYYVTSIIRHIFWDAGLMMSNGGSNCLNWASLVISALSFFILWVYLIF